MRHYIITILCLIAGITYSTNSHAEVRYRGNVALTDQYGVYLGLETSHGILIDGHYAIGAGIGGYMFPKKDILAFVNPFLTFDYYFKAMNSTPVVGIKVGSTHSLGYNNNTDYKFKNAASIGPEIGYIWKLKSGNGISCRLGCPVFFWKENENSDQTAVVMPKISIGFEF